MSGFFARWPDDRDALARSLAVAAAYREHCSELPIAVIGDAAEAGAATLATLAAAGIEDTDLPDVMLDAAATPPAGWQPVAALAGVLADTMEWYRQPSVHDGGGPEVWRAAIGAVEAPGTESAIVVAECVDGLAELATLVPVTVVALDPGIRRLARRCRGAQPVAAVPRPPHAVHLPAAELIAVDGRRADDLRLAAVAPRAVVAEGGALGRLALAAFGLDLAAADDNGVLEVAPLGRAVAV
jgi:hypothetical protein